VSRRLFNSLNNLQTKINAVGQDDNDRLGYAAGLTKETARNAFNSSAFVQDVFDYYYERDGKRFKDVDEARDYFMEDRRWRNMNTISIGRDLYDSKTQNDAQTARLARLQTTFDAMPDFYEDGGDGWQGFRTNAAAGLLDIINVVGFGSGGVAARSAAAGVMAKAGTGKVSSAATQSAIKRARSAGVKAGIIKGGTAEALAGGLVEGVHDIGTQARNIEVGIQDKYSLLQTGAAVGVGAALGAGFGAGFGLAGAVTPKALYNPMAKGFSRGSMISRGIRSGRASAFRSAADARKTAEAQAAEAAANVEPEAPQGIGTAANKARLTEAFTARAAHQRTQELQSQVMEEGLDAEDTSTINVSNSAGVETTASQRFDNAVKAMNDSVGLAAKYDADADKMVSAGGDETKIAAARDLAARHRAVADNIEVQLQIIDSPNQGTADADIKLLEDLTEQQKLIGVDPTVATAMDNDPEAKVGEGFVAENHTSGMGKALVEDVDNRVGAVLGRTSRGENLTGGDQASETAGQTLSDANEAALAEREAKIEASMRAEVDVANQKQQELDEVVAEANREVIEADRGLRKEQIGTTAEGDPIEKVVSEPDSPELKSYNEKRAALNEATEAADKQRKIVEELKTRNAEETARFQNERAERHAAKAKSSWGSGEPDAGEEGPAPVDSTPEEAVTPSDDVVFEELIANATKAETRQGLLDWLVDNLGGNLTSKQLAAQVNAAGKGNSKAAKAARISKMREITAGFLGRRDAMIIINDLQEGAYNRVVFETILEGKQKEIYDNPAAYFEPALKEYDAWINDQASQIYTDRIIDDGLLPDAAITSMRKDFGEEMADIAEATAATPKTQRVEFTPSKKEQINKFIQDLPSSMGNELNQFKEEYLKSLLASGKVDLATAKATVEELAAQKADRWMRNEGNFVARNQDAISQDIEINRETRRAFNKALQKMLDTFKPSLAEKAAGKQYKTSIEQRTFQLKGYDFGNILASPGGDPVGGTLGAERIRYVINSEGKVASPSQEAHLAARADIARLIRKYGFKDNTRVSDIINILDERNAKLQRSRQTYINIGRRSLDDETYMYGERAGERTDSAKKLDRLAYNQTDKRKGNVKVRTDQGNYRTSAGIDVSENAAARGDGSHIGYSQQQATGKITVWGKTQEGKTTTAQLQKIFNKGKGGKLFQKTRVRNGQTGKVEILSSHVTAKMQILDGAIDAASEQRVNNPVKAQRNLPYTAPRMDAIKQLDKALNKLKNAQNPRPTKKNPDPVADPQKIQKAQDEVDALHSRLKLATFEINDPSLKKSTQILVNSTQLQFARQALVNSTDDASVITDAQVMRRALKGIVSDLNSSTKKEAAADNKVKYLEDSGLADLQTEYNVLRNKLQDVTRGKLEKQSDGSLARTGEKVALEPVEFDRMRDQLTRLGKTLQEALDTGAKVDPNKADAIISAPGKERAKAARIKFARDRAEGDQATRDAAQEAAYNERRGVSVDQELITFDHITDPELRDQLEADAFNAAVTAELNNRAYNGPELTDEDYAAMAGIDPEQGRRIPPSVKKAAKKAADTVMQEEGASVERGEAIADLLAIKREQGLSNEWLKVEIKKIEDHYRAKTKPVKTPDNMPSTPKGRPPYIRVIDGIEIDLFNDLDYADLGDGKTRIKFEGFTLGTVETMPDGKAVFTRSGNGRVRVYDQRIDLIDDLLPMFRESFNKVADQMPNKYRRKDGQVGTQYPIDHNLSETYGQNKPQTPNNQKNETPLDTPAKPVNPDDPLTHNGEYYASQIPTGKMFAIQIVDETSKLKGSVRATSMKKPQSAGDMLKNSSRYKFIFGHVDLPATGVSRKDQLIETFRPMDPNDSFYNRNGQLVTVADADAELAKAANIVPDGSNVAEKKTKAADLDKIKDNPIQGSAENLAIYKEAFGQDAPMTIGALNDNMFKLENLSWQSLKTNNAYKNFMKVRSAVAALMNSSAKNGIKRPVAYSVKNNYNQLQKVMAEHAPDDLAASLSFLENLYTFTGKSPLIEAGDVNEFVPSYTDFGSKRNRVFLDKEQIAAGNKRHTPITATVIHETAHWLYANVLDETDKFQFWSAMEKFYGDAEANGELDLDLVANGSVDPQLFKNSLSSPAEYFANQFLTWVTSNGQVNNISLWGKIAQLGTMLLNNLLGREARGVQLDPDLIPIFQKHMPVLEPDPTTGRMNVGISRFAHLRAMGAKYGKPAVEGRAQNVAAVLGEKIELLDTARLKLLGAKMRTPSSLDDSLSLATDMEDVMHKVFGMFGGKAGNHRHFFNPNQAGSGNARFMLMDRTPQRETLLRAQRKVYDFLDTLTKNKRAFNPDVEDTKKGDDEIRKLLDSGATTTEATEAKIRQDSPYSNLDERIIQEMDVLATNLNNAIDVMNRAMLAKFNRQMPRDATTDLYLGINFQGRAEVRKINRTSEKFKAVARQDAADFQSKKEALDLIVAQYNRDGLNIADVDPDDLANMVDELAVPVAPLEALQRHILDDRATLTSVIQSINELGARPDLSAVPTLKELYQTAMARGEFAQKILAELVAMSEGGQKHLIVQRLAKAAAELGDPLWVQIALRWKTDPRNIGVKSEGTYTPTDQPSTDTPLAVEVSKGAMTHRRKDVESVLQSLYTAFHNAGVSQRTERGDVIDTEYTAHVITGMGPNRVDDDGNEVVLSHDTPLFKEMRTTLRKLAVKITRANDARSFKAKSSTELDKRKADLQSILYEDVLPDMYMMAYRMLPEKQQQDIFDAAQVSYAQSNTRPDATLDLFITRAMRQTNSGVKPDIGKTDTVDDRLKTLLKRQYEDSSQNQALGGTFTYDPPKFAVADVENGLKEIGQIVFDLTHDILAFPKDTIAFKRDYDEANKYFNSGEAIFLLSPTKEEVAIARTPVLMATKAVSPNVISPIIAPRYGRELVTSMSEKMQATVRTFLGSSLFTDIGEHLRFNKSPNTNVEGITRTTDGPYGDGVYMSRATEADAEFDAEDFMQQTESVLRSSSLSDIEIDGGMLSAEHIVYYRESILDLLNRSQDQNGVVNHELKRLLTLQDRHWRHLNSLDSSLVQPKVTPVFAKMSSPFDLTSQSVYSFSNDAQDNIAYLIGRMVQAKLLNFNAVEELMDTASSTFSGAALHRTLTGDAGLMVKHGTAQNGLKARQNFNKFMQGQGYDALETDIGDVVFASSAVRKAEGGFTPVDASYSSNPTRNFERKMGGSLAEEMAVLNGEVPPGYFANLVNEGQKLELPAQLVPTLGKIFKKQDLTEQDQQKVSKLSSVVNFFSENAAHFRNVGANWYADKIKPENGSGFYEQHDVELHNTINETFRKLNKLPDAGGRLSQWANRNRGLLLKDVKQPASHKRIISALRRGRGAVQQLSEAEREVASEIGRLFEAELGKMRALGINVGDARKLGNDFYIPQVWDVDELLANPNRFKQALTNYFRREQDKPDYQGQKRHSMSELEEKASNVHYRLTKGHDPSVDTHVQKALGNIFAPRVLMLEPGDMPEMDNFLVTDLQGIMSKYFDRTIRKRLLTERFGLNGHGFDTYLDVARGATMGGQGNGIDRAVEILRSQKHTSAYGGSKEGPLQVDDVKIPRVVGRGDEIKNLLMNVKEQLGDTPESRKKNKHRAKAMLINAVETSDRDNANYNIRVDAIINAMIDFPANNRISNSNESKMRDMMNVLNKRSIDGGDGTELRYVVSRNMKAFNSVSLLGFTTLTSMPDMVLSLIRSGDMKAFYKAWRGYTKFDPSYREAARNIGVGIENLMHDRAVQHSGAGNQKFTNSFFNLTGLTAWTNMNREVSAMVGFESFKTEINRAIKMRAEGQAGSRAYQTSVRYLTRYGLTGDGVGYDFLKHGAKRLDELPPGEEGIKQQVQMAMLRFTNESVFMPNPNDTPLWAQNPWQSMLWQLKSFPLMMARLSGYVLKEAKNGNFKPMIYLSTAGVGMGAASVMVKDVAQMRGGEDERSMALRERKISGTNGLMLWSIAQSLGAREDDDVDKFLGLYFEGLLAVGGLGLFAEMIYNSAAQLDNGAYGTVRIASSIFGPAVGTGVAVKDVATGVQDFITGDGENTGKRRAMLRSIAMRVPILGGVSSVREGFADLGGEPNTGGSKSSSDFNSSLFGGTFD